MKDNQSKYVEEVISGFQLNKGKASVYCFPPINYAKVIVSIIKQFYIKNNQCQVFIVVDSYKTRVSILDALNKDGFVYNIKILTADFIKPSYKYDYKLIISIGVNDNLKLLQSLEEQAKFMLTIFTKNIMDHEFISIVRDILPAINTTVSANSVRTDNIYSPVEEYRLGVSLTDDDRTLYDKYSEYIATSISIFGDMSNIEKCKYGEPNLNISSAEFRDTIAKENGWSVDLDMSAIWSKQIDDVYNPNILYERANNFYNITKQRKDLLTDNVAKLDAILDIVNKNIDKKILIVSKRGEFASRITKHINESLDQNRCADYHDNIESTTGVDEYGDIVLVKSGKDRGKPKVFGAIAQSGSNMAQFNASSATIYKGGITILSVKNSSSVKLECTVDLIIYSSAFIDDIVALKTRFANVTFKGVPTIVYKVYCKGTIESKYLANSKQSPLITVIDDTEDNIKYDDTGDNVYL